MEKGKPTYVLLDLEIADTFEVNCADAGPLDWHDDKNRLYRSLSEQPWKTWWTDDLKVRAVPFLNFHGWGPFDQGQIFQKFANQAPVNVYCRVISCNTPASTRGMTIQQLRKYRYTMRTCFKTQVFAGKDLVFDIDCEEVHCSGNWRPTY